MKRPTAGTVAWVYRVLLKRFGPRGWWPVTPPGGGRPLYAKKNTTGRLTAPQQFEVAVGTILTQNTAWTNVEKALVELGRAGLLSSRALRRAPLAKLYRAIRSSGYFRQKSRRLRDFCRFLAVCWGDRLDRFLDRPTAIVRRELLGLKGVGPETADSILLYAGRHPVFVVDAYTRRFGRRFGFFRTDDYQTVQGFFAERTRPAAAYYREYHALLVELGKNYCRAAPRCAGCPLRLRCATGRPAR
ncbi:MAG TPA: hypothetical protein P5079_07610 [Elusimicrobiota bacterium]|nr:hypothetical protein [Elusimicrobiota bacterium]